MWHTDEKSERFELVNLHPRVHFFFSPFFHSSYCHCVWRMEEGKFRGSTEVQRRKVSVGECGSEREREREKRARKNEENMNSMVRASGFGFSLQPTRRDAFSLIPTYMLRRDGAADFSTARFAAVILAAQRLPSRP